MPYTGNETLQKEFEQTLNMLAQQTNSALLEAVTVGAVHSVSKRYTNYDKVTAVKKTGRHEPSPETPTPLSNVWTVQETWAVRDWIDAVDDAQSIAGDLTNAFNQNFIGSLNRAKDGVILRALGGAVTTGETGGSSAVFDNAYKVAVNDHAYDPQAGAGDVCLTTYKLQKAAALIGAHGSPLSGIYEVGCSMKQFMALVSDQRFASWLYNSNRPLQQMGMGLMGIWGNFRFHVFADDLLSAANFTVDGSADELAYVFARESVQCDFSESLVARVVEDKDHHFDTEVYARTSLGAARRDQRKVVQIACDPTPTL